MTEQMFQIAPYPHNLVELVIKTEYADWSLNVDTYEREVGGEGLTLRIRVPAPDSSAPEGPAIFWVHDFEVPARTLSDENWMRWVFECIMACHRHEAMEAFTVNGTKVFYPDHDVMADMYETKHTVTRRSIG